MPVPALNDKSDKLLGRNRRAWLTAANELLQNGTGSLIALLITPYLAAKLGYEQYGIWLMIVQLLGYVAWADLSPGSALKLSLITRQHEQDFEPLRRIVSASLVVALINLPIYVLGWFLLYRFMPLLLHNSVAWVPSARAAIGILLLGGFLSNFFSVFSNILRAMNMAFKAMGMRSLVLVAFGVSQVVVVGLGFGMPALAFMRLLGEFGMSILLFSVARKALPWLGWSYPKLHDVLALLKLSPWLFLYSFGYTLFQSSDLLLVGWILGPAVAASYGLTKTLPLLADRWLRPLVLSTTAGMGDLYGRKDLGRLAMIRMELQMFTMLLASVGGALALVLNKSFVTLWIGGNQFAGDAANLMVVLAVIFSLISVSDLTLLDMAGYLPRRTVWYTLCGLVAVVSTVFLGRQYGTAGAAAGIMLGQFMLLSGIQVMVFRLFFNFELWLEYAAALFRPIFLTAIILGCSFWFGHTQLFSSWESTGFAAILIAGGAFGIMWFAGFNGGQRGILQGRLLSPIQEWGKRSAAEDGVTRI